MDWKSAISGYVAYLKLERSLAENSVSAYERDIRRLADVLNNDGSGPSPDRVTLDDLRGFLKVIGEIGLAASSQARLISSIKSFFGYLMIEKAISSDPSELLESPNLGRKLPDTLSIEEIQQIIDSIDLSKSGAERNKAMLETLYSCGLRVSELTGLLLSNMHFKDGFIKVLGKGNKERLVPVGHRAIKQINIYLKAVRNNATPKPGDEDIVFLNQRGGQLSRVMVFTLIKDLAQIAGIDKNISPHTFRHSFATHLIEGGANLRAVQEMLGHASVTTTEIYTHLDRDYLRSEILDHHPRYQ